MDYSRMVMRRFSKIDDIAHLSLAEDCFRRKLEIEFVDESKQFSREEMAEFAAIGVRGFNYRAQGSTSQVAMYIQEAGLELTEPLRRLRDCMDKENQEGYLSRLRPSVAWLCKQAYRLGHDPENVVAAWG